ncbi:MAG: hypothetical protein KDK53_04035 [Maritimibacter sp.]|nr:hypothetical protein [Maritimibacter sp.]
MSRSSLKSRLWALAPLAMLLFAGWQTVAILSRTPAFNHALVVETPQDRRIPPDTNAYYDRAALLYWTARLWFDRYRFAEFDSRDAEVAARAVLDIAAADAAARTAADVRESLKLKPGDPDSWILLAKAERARGNLEAALGAWHNCHALARQSSVLAAERMDLLVTLMDAPGGWDLALSTVEPEMVRGDLEAMQARMGLLLPFYDASPAVAALIGDTAADS